MSRAALPLLGAVLVAACALQPAEPERARTFLLEPAISIAPGAASDRVIAVSAPRADAGFDTTLIAYSRRPSELEYFARNRWVDAPARMLAPLITQALERSGSFRAVVPAPGAGAADLRLDTELVRLQHDFTTSPSRVRVALRAQLTELASRRVAASALLEEEEVATSDDPYGGVMAADRATARLLARLAAFCAAGG